MCVCGGWVLCNKKQNKTNIQQSKFHPLPMALKQRSKFHFLLYQIPCTQISFFLWFTTVCVNQMGNGRIICYYIVYLLRVYGHWYFASLLSHGLCRLVSRTWWLLGWELLRKFARQEFRVLSLIVLCGYFGVNAINKLLREWNDWS